MLQGTQLKRLVEIIDSADDTMRELDNFTAPVRGSRVSMLCKQNLRVKFILILFLY